MRKLITNKGAGIGDRQCPVLCWEHLLLAFKMIMCSFLHPRQLRNGNLLEVQIFRPDLRPILKHWIRGCVQRLSYLCCNLPSRWFWSALKCENHYIQTFPGKNYRLKERQELKWGRGEGRMVYREPESQVVGRDLGRQNSGRHRRVLEKRAWAQGQ